MDHSSKSGVQLILKGVFVLGGVFLMRANIRNFVDECVGIDSKYLSTFLNAMKILVLRMLNLNLNLNQNCPCCCTS